MTADPHPGLTHLVAVMDRLRSPGGCEWDAEQTHETLAEYAIEETYELLEAIDTGDRIHLREELGDVLLQVVFHARVAMDDPDDPFDIDEIAFGIANKLQRRHPHVFDDAPPPPADDVEGNWEKVKAAEKGRTTPLEGVPTALPPLAAIAKIQYRASIAGLSEELYPPDDDLDVEEAFGDALLVQVLEAADEGIDAERALRGAVRRARARVEAAS